MTDEQARVANEAAGGASALSAGLGCRRMTKQLLNSGQGCSPLRLRFWSEVKDKRLKWAFCLLYICLQGIFFCGALEAAPAIPDNVRLEGDDRGQVAVVVLKDYDRCGLMTGSEAKQSVSERGAKCGTGDGYAVGAVVAPSDKTTKSGKQEGAKDGVGVSEEGFNHFWFWIYVVIALLPIWLANDPYGGFKPNV